MGFFGFANIRRVSFKKAHFCFARTWNTEHFSPFTSSPLGKTKQPRGVKKLSKDRGFKKCPWRRSLKAFFPFRFLLCKTKAKSKILWAKPLFATRPQRGSVAKRGSTASSSFLRSAKQASPWLRSKSSILTLPASLTEGSCPKGKRSLKGSQFLAASFAKRGHSPLPSGLRGGSS